MARGLYYGSYRIPRNLTWFTGLVIFLLTIITAFLGYNSLKWLDLDYVLRNSYFSDIKISLYSAFYPGYLDFIKPGIKIEKHYENLNTVETQLLIRDENKHKSGIYMIINLVNRKFYIGSAISNRINVRFRNHCLHRTGSAYLNNAINKYGLENFAFIILEYFPHLVLKENLKSNHLRLLELETNYIKEFKPEYNILQSGVSSIGYKHSEETKEKMRALYSEERKLRIKNLNLNKKLSKYTKQLIKLKALLRGKIDESAKNQISKKLSKPLILYNLDGTIHSRYSGIRVMAKAFRCCHKTINKAIASNKIFKDIGYIKYETKDK
jgi:group I intron endonuclease